MIKWSPAKATFVFIQLPRFFPLAWIWIFKLSSFTGTVLKLNGFHWKFPWVWLPTGGLIGHRRIILNLDRGSRRLGLGMETVVRNITSCATYLFVMMKIVTFTSWVDLICIWVEEYLVSVGSTVGLYVVCICIHGSSSHLDDETNQESFHLVLSRVAGHGYKYICCPSTVGGHGYFVWGYVQTYDIHRCRPMSHMPLIRRQNVNGCK